VPTRAAQVPASDSPNGRVGPPVSTNPATVPLAPEGEPAATVSDGVAVLREAPAAASRAVQAKAEPPGAPRPMSEAVETLPPAPRGQADARAARGMPATSEFTPAPASPGRVSPAGVTLGRTAAAEIQERLSAPPVPDMAGPDAAAARLIDARTDNRLEIRVERVEIGSAAPKTQDAAEPSKAEGSPTRSTPAVIDPPTEAAMTRALSSEGAAANAPLTKAERSAPDPVQTALNKSASDIHVRILTSAAGGPTQKNAPADPLHAQAQSVNAEAPRDVPAALRAQPQSVPPASPQMPAQTGMTAQAGKLAVRPATEISDTGTDPRAASDADGRQDAERRPAPTPATTTLSAYMPATPAPPTDPAKSALFAAMAERFGASDGKIGSLDMTLGDLGAGEGRALDSKGAPADPVLARPEASRAPMAQIAEAARRLPDGPIEISLSPEELGRVRLSMNGADGAMTVQILAERPETLDMIRRHIDLLAADLKEAGFTSLTFAFAGGDGGGAETAFGPDFDASAATGEAATDHPVTPILPMDRARLDPADGLDLRL